MPKTSSICSCFNRTLACDGRIVVIYRAVAYTAQVQHCTGKVAVKALKQVFMIMSIIVSVTGINWTVSNKNS